MHCNLSKELSKNDVYIQRVGGFPWRTTRGSSNVNVQTFCCKKTQNFRKLWCVRTVGRGWASAYKGGQFCTYVFYGRSLSLLVNIFAPVLCYIVGKFAFYIAFILQSFVLQISLIF